MNKSLLSGAVLVLILVVAGLVGVPLIAHLMKPDLTGIASSDPVNSEAEKEPAWSEDSLSGTGWEYAETFEASSPNGTLEAERIIEFNENGQLKIMVHLYPANDSAQAAYRKLAEFDAATIEGKWELKKTRIACNFDLPAGWKNGPLSKLTPLRDIHLDDDQLMVLKRGSGAKEPLKRIF